jgi:putative transposase
MARPLRIEFPGAFYHVTARGNEKKDIFRSHADRGKFLSYLASAAQRYNAVIHAYCLMTNHYHLLLETPEGNISDIIQYVNGAYTTYFNVKRKRSGHLFQGRFKSIVVDVDEYALELSRYIHLNPVRVGMVRKPEDHEWSSYRSYAGLQASAEWLKTDLVLSYFGGDRPHEKYRNFVEDLLGAEYTSPLESVLAATLLGRPEFIAEISEKHVNMRKVDRSVPAVRALSYRLSIQDIAQKVGEILPDRQSLARKVTMYFCYRYGGGKLKEIGERFGIGDTAVSQANKRLSMQAEKNPELKEILEKVRKGLNL